LRSCSSNDNHIIGQIEVVFVHIGKQALTPTRFAEVFGLKIGLYESVICESNFGEALDAIILHETIYTFYASPIIFEGLYKIGESLLLFSESSEMIVYGKTTHVFLLDPTLQRENSLV
jgi:hypothetical protein